MAHVKFSLTRKAFSRLKQAWFAPNRNRSKGFTLLELLTATAIAGGLIAGLLYVVVELTSTDQRESARSETQREMQMALDYMSAELREAVYVYSGAQVQTVMADGVNRGSLADFLPAAVSQNGTPILAFWKQQPFPLAIREFCSTATMESSTARGINCEAGSSYALIVYSLSTNNPDGTWRGRARLTRYALTQFNNQGDDTQGYVNPAEFGIFASWPFGRRRGDAQSVNLQQNSIRTGDTARVGRPVGSAVPLVDFVNPTTAGGAPACPNDPTTSSADYSLSPGTGRPGFYVCISIRPNRTVQTGNVSRQQEDTGVNQDVILYLQGSVEGRPGYPTGITLTGTESLPTLETRVLTRGVLSRTP